MVTLVKVVRNGNRYSICTTHGHLKEKYDRNDLVPRKGHTAEMQGIDEKHPGFRRQMIIQDACNAYSKMEHYNCKGNFETLARCACRVTVKRCTFLCHGGRGNNKLCGMLLPKTTTNFEWFGSHLTTMCVVVWRPHHHHACCGWLYKPLLLCVCP